MKASTRELTWQAGKGDRARNVGPKFKKNYDKINWHRNSDKKKSK